MKILGIDPALIITGYGAIYAHKESIALIEAGIIKTVATDKIEVRLKKIYRGVSDLISEVKPEAVVLEKLYAHYRHPTTAYILGHARGVIALAVAEKNIPLFEYAATKIKKSIVGNGLASKYQVERMVVNMLGLKEVPKYNDITDALALAIAHSHYIKVRGLKYDRTA